MTQDQINELTLEQVKEKLSVVRANARENVDTINSLQTKLFDMTSAVSAQRQVIWTILRELEDRERNLTIASRRVVEELEKCMNLSREIAMLTVRYVELEGKMPDDDPEPPATLKKRGLSIFPEGRVFA